MKSWVKGGIIGAIIGLLDAVWIIATPSINLNWTVFLAPMLIFFLLIMAKNDCFKCFPQDTAGCQTPIACSESPKLLLYIPGFLINIFVYFLIGALIGWIVGKIKEKNEKN